MPNYVSKLSVDNVLALVRDTEAQTLCANLRNDLTSETSARKSADTALGARIDTETSARESADTALGGRIDVETSDRKRADTALGSRIDEIITSSNNNRIINVIDIGCDPTGATDCSTIINTAIENKQDFLLYFPAGKYLVNNTIKIYSNCIIIGEIKSTYDGALFEINNSNIDFIFNKIIAENDEETIRYSTAIKFAEEKIIRGVNIRGNNIVAKKGIEITARGNGYKQENHISVNAIYSNEPCIEISVAGNTTWNNENTIFNTAFHGGGLKGSNAEGYIDAIRVTNCSFEECDPAIELNKVKNLTLIDCRLIYGENVKNNFFKLNDSCVTAIGRYFCAQSTATIDTTSFVHFIGEIYDAWSKLRYTEAFLITNTSGGIQLLGKNTPLTPVQTITFTDNNQELTLSNSENETFYDSSFASVNVGNHTGCRLNLSGGGVRNFLNSTFGTNIPFDSPFTLLNIDGSGSLTTRNNDGIERTLNLSEHKLFIVNWITSEIYPR